MTFNQFLNWFSVISFSLNVILGFVAIWQLKDARSEKNRKKDQVKIWMQDANGISSGLQRIVRDNLDKRYSSTQDIANAVWTLEASAFSLRQSLYEERCVTEEEYKKQQKLFQEQLEKRQNSENNNPTPQETHGSRAGIPHKTT